MDWPRCSRFGCGFAHVKLLPLVWFLILSLVSREASNVDLLPNIKVYKTTGVAQARDSNADVDGFG